MSLYSITTEYQRLITAIEDGEIPEEAIADTIEGLSAEWNERAEAVTSAIKNLMAEADMIKAEESALKARRQAKENTAQRLVEYLSRSMQAIGCENYESARHSVSFKKSTAICITDENAFLTYALTEYPSAVRHKETFEPDKTVIKELLKTVNLPHVAVEERLNIQIK